MEAPQYIMVFLTGAMAQRGSYYGPGNGPVYLDVVRCTGEENSITDCSHSVVGDVSVRCLDHTNDASVQCREGTEILK